MDSIRHRLAVKERVLDDILWYFNELVQADMNDLYRLSRLLNEAHQVREEAIALHLIKESTDE